MKTFMPLVLPLLSFFVAWSGLVLSLYIHAKKRAREVLVCPLGMNCDPVIRSEHSTFLRFPVELLGAAYYGTVAAASAAFVLVPALAGTRVVLFVFALTAAALLFSLYLTFIQLFALRQWCTWCLLSALFCIVLLLNSVLGYAPQLLAAVGEQRAALLVVHTLGIAFGLGGATVSDILFFNFLRDFRISPKESRVLRTLSQVIWLALAVLFLSGLGLYLPKMDVLNHSSKFLLKVVVVCVIIVNGAFLNLLIAPNLTRLSFDGRRDATEKKLRRMRKIAFALGGVSFTSWYSAFILGSLRSVPLAFWQLLLVYGVLLALAVLASQVVARQIFRRARARPALSSPHV